MPVSDLEMGSTSRIPYGTRVAVWAGNGIMRTRVGPSAALQPEKKATLYHGYFSSRYTVLTARA
jgi:hypothetical protein